MLPALLFALSLLLPSAGASLVNTAATGLLPSVGATLSTVTHLAFPNISHTRSDVLLSQASALCFVPTLPLSSARLSLRTGQGRLRMAAAGDENPIVDSLKRALVFVERVMVTLTSGTEMAKAQAAIEEDRLFGSRRLAKVRNYVGTTLTSVRKKMGTRTLDLEKTASLKDCYSAGSFSEPATVPIHAGRKPWESARLPTHEDTASMLDCYSPWSADATSQGYFESEPGLELSAGYNEGVAGDDLPLLKNIHVTRRGDKEYTADRVLKKYPGLSDPHA